LSNLLVKYGVSRFGVAHTGEQGVETDESRAIVALQPVQFAGVDPLLDSGAVEVRDDLKVFKRDHFGFGAALGT
jgi:hypothetical protein